MDLRVLACSISSARYCLAPASVLLTTTLLRHLLPPYAPLPLTHGMFDVPACCIFVSRSHVHMHRPNLAAKALGIIAVVAKAAGSDSAHTEVFLSAAMERLVQKDADAVRSCYVYCLCCVLPPLDVPVLAFLLTTSAPVRSCPFPQKIKSASIQACSALVAFGGAPAPKAAAVVSTLLDRLSNEATRLATLEAFVVMSSSPLSLDLTQVATGLTDASEALLRCCWVSAC